MRSLDIGVVLGTGGYASVPGVLGARLARRPVVLLEPNAVPGAANRLLSRWAAVAAVATERAGQQLHCRSVATGVPVRPEFSVRFEPAVSTGPVHLLILGGSQGARQLNLLLPAALAALAPELPGLRVTHQVGADQVEPAQQAYQKHAIKDFDLRIVPFLDDMAATMATAHLILSRAGAVTLAEICAVGRAALLLPLTLAGCHQVVNANALVEVGGAEVLSPTETTPATLAHSLGVLLRDRQRLAEMGQALQRLARPAAAANVADLVAGVTGAN